MNKQLFIACLIATALCWTIQEASKNQLTKKSHSNSLGFGNYTGYCISQNQIKTFIQSANDANKIYGREIIFNLAYIRNAMNSIDPTSNDMYFVIIQETSPITSSWAVYSNQGCSVATFAGINENQPQWSYMFIVMNYPVLKTYTLVIGYATGSGITSQTQNAIAAILKETETQQQGCDCGATAQIQRKLVIRDGQYWSVICDSKSYVGANIAPVRWQYLYTSTWENRCNYMMFVV